jgi:hypothetical protein
MYNFKLAVSIFLSIVIFNTSLETITVQAPDIDDIVVRLPLGTVSKTLIYYWFSHQTFHKKYLSNRVAAELTAGTLYSIANSIKSSSNIAGTVHHPSSLTQDLFKLGTREAIVWALYNKLSPFLVHNKYITPSNASHYRKLLGQWAVRQATSILLDLLEGWIKGTKIQLNLVAFAFSLDDTEKIIHFVKK